MPAMLSRLACRGHFVCDQREWRGQAAVCRRLIGLSTEVWAAQDRPRLPSLIPEGHRPPADPAGIPCSGGRAMGSALIRPRPGLWPAHTREMRPGRLLTMFRGVRSVPGMSAETPGGPRAGEAARTHAFAALRQAILSGDIAPGQRLVEEEL